MKSNPVVIGSFYQDQKAGERMIKNLSEFDIPSIWSNGRVKGFTKLNNSDLSTDNLKEIILSYPNTKVFDLGLTYPSEATTFLMHKAALLRHSHSLLLSCDEYLEGDWNILKENLSRLEINEPKKIRLALVDHGGKYKNFTERIVNMPEYVYIKKVHYVYYHDYFKTEKIMMDSNSPLVTGITVHHDDSIRESARNKLMDKYQAKRQLIEIQELADLIINGKLKHE